MKVLLWVAPNAHDVALSMVSGRYSCFDHMLNLMNLSIFFSISARRHSPLYEAIIFDQKPHRYDRDRKRVSLLPHFEFGGYLYK